MTQAQKSFAWQSFLAILLVIALMLAGMYWFARNALLPTCNFRAGPGALP